MFLHFLLAAHVSAECPPVTNGETTYVFELPQQIEDGIGTISDFLIRQKVLKVFY